MRLNRTRLQLVLAGAVLAAVVSLVLLLRDEASSSTRSGVTAAPVSVASPASQSGRPTIRQETKRPLGVFRVGNRTIRMSAAETIDGMGCLIEEEGESFASSCLERGLFSERRAELMVSSMGGPERFDELRVVGVVAPSVGGVLLVKTDATRDELSLNEYRAFAYESTAADLASRVLPTALLLVGRNGRVVETIDFPAGS